MLSKSSVVLFVLLWITQWSFSATGIVTSINDSGTGSLREVIGNASSGDTIRFDPSLIASGSDTIKLESEIYINKFLVIKGLYDDGDTLVISGENQTRIFDVNYSGKTADIELSLIHI